MRRERRKKASEEITIKKKAENRERENKTIMMSIGNGQKPFFIEKITQGMVLA